jgi:hypothetical protein
VQWEVALTLGRAAKADLVVDDDPADPDADLYEAKVWKGARTFAEVAAQLVQYQILASDRGLAWRSGQELSDSNWAVSYYGHPETLSERLFLDAPIWYAWAPIPATSTPPARTTLPARSGHGRATVSPTLTG